MSVCVSPTLFNKVFATLKWVCWKIGNIIFKCNLFRIFWSRSAAFIYSYSSLSSSSYSTRKNFKPTRKMLNPQNTYKIKFWTYGKYPRKKMSNPRNTHENKFRTHEIPTRKNLGPMKCPWENVSDPRRHSGTMARDPRWHKTHGISTFHHFFTCFHCIC